MADICRKAGIRQATYFNWKKKYDGLLPTEMRRLKQIEDENSKLRKVVAGLSLDGDAPGRHPPKALRPVRKRNKSTRYRPVSRLGLGDCDLSYGLIVGADVCIDGLTTLRKHCRYAVVSKLHHRYAPIYSRKGQDPPYVIMLLYCLGISRGKLERNTE